MTSTTYPPMPMQILPPSPTLVHEPSLQEVHASVRLSATTIGWRRLLGFFGPGFMIAVGYMDPGNWATDIAGGSQFGYTLLFAIMISNLLAVLLQSLSLKLGVASEHDLAQVCREAFGPQVSFALWIGAEIAIAACDLAEVIGAAIALELLFHIPLIWGVLITGTDVLLLLLLERWGLRYLEALVITLIGTILVLFTIQVALCHPEHWLALKSFFGSLREAPRAKVSFTTCLYDSPVQTIPSWDQTGVPGDFGFAHFHSSTMSGSASWMSWRTCESVSPLQSPSS